MGKKHYTSHSPRRNDEKEDKGSNIPPGICGYYPHRSGGGCDGPYCNPGYGDDGSPSDPYGASSDRSSSSEFKDDEDEVDMINVLNNKSV